MAAYELRQLSPAVLEAAKRTIEQPGLFGVDAQRVGGLAASPIDHALADQLALARETDRDAAILAALGRALDERLDAQLREARVHMACEGAPRESAALIARMGASINAADIPALVAQRASSAPLPRPSAPAFDLDADLRGKP